MTRRFVPVVVAVILVFVLPASTLYASNYSAEVLADNPIAYYRLSETSGTSANDSSPNNNIGTYVGTPTLGVGGAVTAAPAAGKLTVAWSGFADNSGGSGIASYQLAYAKGATPAPACTSGLRVSPATSGHLLIGLSPGNYTVRVCPVDAVGNVGVGVTRSANVP